MANLSIVWRNPNRIGHRRRWLRRPSSTRRAYVMQELVSADADIWVNVAALEVIRSSPKPTPESAKPWLLRLKW